MGIKTQPSGDVEDSNGDQCGLLYCTEEATRTLEFGDGWTMDEEDVCEDDANSLLTCEGVEEVDN